MTAIFSQWVYWKRNVTKEYIDTDDRHVSVSNKTFARSKARPENFALMSATKFDRIYWNLSTEEKRSKPFPNSKWNW